MLVGFTTTYAVPITTNVVSSNPTQTRSARYNIIGYSLSVTCVRMVGFTCFLHQWNWPQRFNCKIVESGVKHHKTNPKLSLVIKRIYKWKYRNDIEDESIYGSNLINPQCLNIHLIGCWPVYGKNNLSWNIIVSWLLRK